MIHIETTTVEHPSRYAVDRADSLFRDVWAALLDRLIYLIADTLTIVWMNAVDEASQRQPRLSILRIDTEQHRYESIGARLSYGSIQLPISDDTQVVQCLLKRHRTRLIAV